MKICIIYGAALKNFWFAFHEAIESMLFGASAGVRFVCLFSFFCATLRLPIHFSLFGLFALYLSTERASSSGTGTAVVAH